MTHRTDASPSPAGPARASIGWFAGLAAVTFVLDQITKWWALSGLTAAFRGPGGAELSFGERLAAFLTTQHPPAVRRVDVIEGLWQHAYHENPGAAWSLMHDAPEDVRMPFFIGVTLVALLAALWYVRRSPDLWTRVAVGLIVGGALGNFFDRLRLGYVIDFVRWHWFDRITWPIFNVADVGVTLGVGLMLWVTFQTERAERRARAAAAERGLAERADRTVSPGAPMASGTGE